MQNAKNRSKRLRKKLFVGEFAVMGFEFSCKINLDNESDFDVLFDGLVDLIESRNLLVGGGGDNNDFEGYILSKERYGSATEEDRAAILAWLNAQNPISDSWVGELSDAYYSN